MARLRVSVLQGFMRQLEAALSPLQAAYVREREAAALGITRDDWATLREMPIDLVMVREAHRLVSGTKANVRRADRHGAWSLVSAKPGQLRSHPQSMRVGDHVEPAWNHETLKRRLAELVSATRAAPTLATIAAFIRDVVRAQPFPGDNEPLALVVASLLLCSAGFPPLAIASLEHTPTFHAALIATEVEPMVSLLTDAVWTAALELAEVLPLCAPGAVTLAAEHAALAAVRSRWDHGDCHAMANLVARALGDCTIVAHETFAARARATTDASHRGRAICAQRTIIELRQSVDRDLVLIVVIAFAGRGTTGAISAHLSIELPAVPTPRRAPALLIVPEEPASETTARIGRWLPRAIELAYTASPILRGSVRPA